MKYLNLTALLILVSSLCFAQAQESRTYSKAKVYLKNHDILKVRQLKMTKLKASFLNSVNKKNENLPIDDVNFIKAKKGSYLWGGAIYGSITMALSAVLIDLDDDPLPRPKKFGATEYIGFTLIGAGLGALVGSMFPKWENVFSQGKFIGRLSVKMNFDTTNDLASVKITVPL